VKLDGYSYTNCNFYNITFVYNGTTPIQITGMNLYGTHRFRSDNRAVDGAIIEMYAFGKIIPGFEVNLPPGNAVTPLIHVP
jgi:hypothetical protein